MIINIPNKKNEEKKKKKDTKEETKKDIAKAFGLNLADIEHVKLDNGHEFFKFKDPKNQSIRMIENIDYDKKMDDMFKNTQNRLASAQTDDSKKNAKNIFDNNMKNKNTELELITLTDLKNNKWRFKKILRTLSTRIRTQVKILLKNAEKIKLKYINLEYGIGINEKSDVIDVQVDFANRKVNIEKAESIKYTTEATKVDDEEIENTNLTFDEIFKEFNLAGDIPTVDVPKEVEIDGETINTGTVVQLYETPELIDKLSLNSKQQSIYIKLVERISKKIGKASKKEKKNSRQLVKKTNKNDKAA